MRNLASRSAKAASEIKALVEASVKRVEIGAGQVNHTGSTMQEIVGQVQTVSELIGQISAATAEQATALSEVSPAVENPTRSPIKTQRACRKAPRPQDA